MKETKERGITLIALIITIIIMLILAGVTISIMLGENGIVQKSKEASTAQTAAQDKETSELAGAGVEVKIDAIVNGTGTQTISTVVTSGGEQVYYYTYDNLEYCIINNILYYHEGNSSWVYNNLFYEGKYSTKDFVPISEVNQALGGTNYVQSDIDVYNALDYAIFNIYGDWYLLKSNTSPMILAKFELTEFDTSVLEGAIDFAAQENQSSGS